MKKRAIDNLIVWFLVWPPSFLMCSVISFFCLCAVFLMLRYLNVRLLTFVFNGWRPFGAWFLGGVIDRR